MPDNFIVPKNPQSVSSERQPQDTAGSMEGNDAHMAESNPQRLGGADGPEALRVTYIEAPRDD